ncbi:MAG: SMC-Scp complex subunit ScpB [Thermoplasmata archaeon]
MMHSSDEDNEEDVELILEAVLFSAGRPLSVPELEGMTGIDRRELRSAVNKLTRMYGSRKSAIEIKKIGTSYSMQLSPSYVSYGVQVQESEMEEELLKTAALIAYYQPIRQSDLKKKQGEKVYRHVDELKKKGLILVERDGRTYSLRTSSKFQEYFGLEAGDREELKKLMAEKAGIK